MMPDETGRVFRRRENEGRQCGTKGVDTSIGDHVFFAACSSQQFVVERETCAKNEGTVLGPYEAQEPS